MNLVDICCDADRNTCPRAIEEHYIRKGLLSKGRPKAHFNE